MNEPEVKIVGPVTYSHEVSKKEIKFEPNYLYPKSTISVTRLNYDSITQIVYTTNSMHKKYRGEYYLYRQSQIDTFKLSEPDSSIVPTDYFLSGNFKPPVSIIHNWRFEDKGIIFNSDGFCTHTTEGSGSDTPMSTTSQKKGIYRTAGDTIYITYFMERRLFGGGYYKYDDTVKSIEDIPWDVREPFEQIYLLSPTNDTLYNVSKSNSPKTPYYLINSDSLIRIQGR